MQTIKARLEEVTVADVRNLCYLDIPEEQVEDALADAVESLTDQYVGDVDSLVGDYADVLDRWSGDYAPAWVNNGAIEQVISEISVRDVLNLYANHFGGSPESIEDMIGVVHWDLTRATEAVLSEVMGEVADDHTEDE